LNPNIFGEYRSAFEATAADLTRRVNAENVDKRSTAHLRFLAHRTDPALAPPTRRSRFISRVPHPSAGLSYTHAPELQTVFSSKPLPGRRLQMQWSKAKSSALNVAVAGWLGMETVSMHDARVETTDFGSAQGAPRVHRERGKGTFRAWEGTLHRAPRTVGMRPEGLAAAKLEYQFVEWDSASLVRWNPHRPGSREYVAHDASMQEVNPLSRQRAPPPSPPPPQSSMTNAGRPLMLKTADSSHEDVSQKLLLHLHGIIEKTTKGSEGEPSQ